MEQWILFKTLLRSCIKFNATIFGGAVRDLVRHNIHSKKFYENHTFEHYSDFDVSPETLGRLLIPHDIDIRILRKDYIILLATLSRGYCIRELINRDAVYIDGSIEPLKFIQITLQIVSYKPDDISMSFKMDVLIQEDNDSILINPCTKLDFDVNGLNLNKHMGLHLCELLALNPISDISVLYNIFKHIETKNASILPGCTEARHNKMKYYGWNISFTSESFIYSLHETYDGDCIICQDKIPEHECRVRFKKCACDLRICLKCIFMNCSKLNICPLCKTIVYTNPMSELNILDLLSNKTQYMNWLENVNYAVNGAESNW